MSDVWVPVPTRWADVQVDDLIAYDRRMWIVEKWEPTINAWGTVTVRRLGRKETEQRSPQGDDKVNVLRPQLDMLRDELGARTG